jgi:murein DD-endopeptidase MepM/ murein hydrolase activator NlpD
MYTTAGFVVLGGVGAMEATRPPVIGKVDAADYAAISTAVFDRSATADPMPSWAQRLPLDSATANPFQPNPVAEYAQAPTAKIASVAAVQGPAGNKAAPDATIAALNAPAPNASAEVPTNYADIATDAGDRLGHDADPMDFTRAIEPETPSLDLLAQGDSADDEASTDVQRVIEVRRGDTLFGLLVDAGLSDSEAKDAVGALSDVFSPRQLKAGQEITLSMAAPTDDQAAEDGKLVSLTLAPSVERDVTLVRDQKGAFVAEAVDKPLTEIVSRAAGVIDSSLFEAAHDAGLPASVIGEIIKAYSYDVDFQRDIQDGDSFEVVYERYENGDGEFAKTGKMLYAALTMGGETRPIYYFEHDGDGDGDGEYYNALGEAIRKSLLRTPIDGAKITSGFGMRTHPILGYSKMHKGVDFGAPTGTPIYAAGNGVVVEVGQKNGYGNYVRIRHNGTYETAYAHCSRFASGLHKGDRVKQGEVIAYVGATGRATGPHLHFEVLMAGNQVNPKSVKNTTGDKLAGADLKAFKAQVAAVDAKRRDLSVKTEIASRPDDQDSGCTTARGCPN